MPRWNWRRKLAWISWSRLRRNGPVSPITSLEKAVALQSGNGINRAYSDIFVVVYARMGRRDEALRMLKDLQRITDPSYEFPGRVTAQPPDRVEGRPSFTIGQLSRARPH